MCIVDLITRECDDQVVVVLRGELDVTAATAVVAELAVVAARERDIVVDLAGLEFIDSSGLAALVRVRKHARKAGDGRVKPARTSASRNGLAIGQQEPSRCVLSRMAPRASQAPP